MTFRQRRTVSLVLMEILVGFVEVSVLMTESLAVLPHVALKVTAVAVLTVLIRRRVGLRREASLHLHLLLLSLLASRRRTVTLQRSRNVLLMIERVMIHPLLIVVVLISRINSLLRALKVLEMLLMVTSVLILLLDHQLIVVHRV